MLLNRGETDVNVNEVFGEILFDSNEDSGPSTTDAAVVIRASSSQSQGDSNKGGYLSFLTKDNAASATAATERVRITANGRVGIGTSSPIAPLHVETTNSANYGNFTFYALNQYTNNPNNPTSCCSGSVTDVSIHANGRVMATEFDAYSDARIKNIIGVSDATDDLTSLLNIEITNYRMKDRVKDIKQYKKVIAQQLEEVYPDAVSVITDVVPDIYSVATAEDGHIVLKTDLKIGDKVKLILEDRTEMAAVTSTDENGFTVDLKYTGDVFVYGREVSDFRTVDYEAISMLNVSATQELYRLILALQQENKEVKEELKNVASLKTEIELIKEAIGIDIQTSK